VHRTKGRAAVFALALAVAALAPRFSRAGSGDDQEAIEVTVHGSSASGYSARASTDTAPREPIDAASLLAELPSVHIRRLGAHGSFASLSIRGSAGAQIGTVLAGIPLTSAADPSLDLSALPLWPGASFRVYRGFAPASLGPTGYLGGVLAVEPPSPALDQRTEWWAAVGSFGSQQLRIGDLRKTGDLHFGTGLFASRSDGDFPYEFGEDPRTGRLLQGIRSNAGHVSVGGIERVAVERPWGSAGALLFANARKSGVPGPALRSTRLAALDASRLVAGADATLHTGETSALHLLAWGRRETSALEDPLGELDPSHNARTTARSTVEAVGASIGWRGTPIAALTAGLVLDGRAERFVAGRGDHALVSVPAGRFGGGAGAEFVFRPTPALTITGAGRIDGRHDKATDALGPNGAARGASSDLLPTGHLGASYRIADAAVISAHAGALGRPPSFQELYGNSASLVGDASLRPERALSADLGLHGDAGERRASVGYEVVAFVSATRDLIAFTPLGRTTFQAVNIDQALLGGVEISAALRARGLLTQVSYTLLLTQNRSDSPLERGRPLPGRPQHDLAYDASYRFGPVRLRYGLDAIAGTTLDPSATVVLPSRILHGVGASLDVPFLPGLRAGVDIENLFNRRTLYVRSPLTGAFPIPLSDFYGFPLPGRSGLFTLRFSRGRSP
jgi:iron complex outermembrane receptor protein